MKKVLVTGAGSYIGEAVRKYLENEPDRYEVRIQDTVGWEPRPEDMNGFDVVFNAAGIAHIKETKENRHLYYEVNRDLAVKIAKAALEAGVRQYILLSSMSVYGLVTGHITKKTPANPVNAYGKSKAEADETIARLQEIKFCCLRPPMVYGKGCKGNYRSLQSFAMKSPVFPKYKNRRSMIYIGNLCEFVKICIDEEREGIFFPQNAEYVNTSEMVRLIAACHGKKIRLTGIFNPFINILPLGIVKKVFGDLTYEKCDTVDRYSFEESVKESEGERGKGAE